MGRGDKRTKRGKIFRGSFGKSRPVTIKPVIEKKVEKIETTAAAAPKA